MMRASLEETSEETVNVTELPFWCVQLGNVPCDLLTSDSKDLTPASPERPARMTPSPVTLMAWQDGMTSGLAQDRKIQSRDGVKAQA